MADLPIQFGVYLTQADRTWPKLVADFQMAEDLGFDTAWLHDHLVEMDGDRARPFHESWTLLAALAARTSRIRLGILVTSNTFRHPALLAKEAVTVDHISGGRLILGLGTGWNQDEHRRYGIDFPPTSERVARLEEAVQILQLLMSQERTNFGGQFYRLTDAPLEPKPIQAPHVPILIAAHRPRMLQIAARYADQWDTYPSITGTSTQGVTDTLVERMRRFDEACEQSGRDPSKIRRSTSPDHNVLGSPDSFAGFVRANRAAGFTDFLVDPPNGDLDVFRRIASETIPTLRAEL